MRLPYNLRMIARALVVLLLLLALLESAAREKHLGAWASDTSKKPDVTPMPGQSP